MPPKTAEAAHRTLHLCIPDWVEVPDMWTVGHVLYEPLSVLLGNFYVLLFFAQIIKR